MPGPLEKLEDTEQEKLESGSPRFWKPMLATLTHDRFSDENWIFERKLDGERCLAVCRKGEVTLYSRNKKLLNDSYPELVCEIGFTEWTRSGRLQHPRFLGLRRDKDPEKVIREDR